MVAQVEVPEDELVLEYKVLYVCVCDFGSDTVTVSLVVQGKVADMSAVLADFPPGTRSLWKHRPCPFVYIYDKISGLDLCIDARSALTPSHHHTLTLPHHHITLPQALWKSG